MKESSLTIQMYQSLSLCCKRKLGSKETMKTKYISFQQYFLNLNIYF